MKLSAMLMIVWLNYCLDNSVDLFFVKSLCVATVNAFSMQQQQWQFFDRERGRVINKRKFNRMIWVQSLSLSSCYVLR